MAETMIMIFFIGIAAFPTLILGVVQYRSVDPVGFWSGKEPPKPWQILDVKSYNHKHGIMWMLYGAGMMISVLPGFLFGEVGIAACVGLEVIGGLLAMIWYHHHLDNRYYKR